MITLFDLITALEQERFKTLKIKAFIPSLGIEFVRSFMGNGFNSTKAVLSLVGESHFPTHIWHNTNHTLLPQLKTFTDEEGEDDPPGEICWDKEVLLSIGTNHDDASCTSYYFSIKTVEITDDAFKLVAGDEILSLRIEEPPQNYLEFLGDDWEATIDAKNWTKPSKEVQAQWYKIRSDILSLKPGDPFPNYPEIFGEDWEFIVEASDYPKPSKEIQAQWHWNKSKSK
jgi:hypothetical protein